jgi:hypothetical protein
MTVAKFVHNIHIGKYDKNFSGRGSNRNKEGILMPVLFFFKKKADLIARSAFFYILTLLKAGMRPSLQMGYSLRRNRARA